MESLFFNITDRRYKRETLSGYTRVDISNGVLFIESQSAFSLSLKNLDRMLILTYLKNGTFQITDHLQAKTTKLHESQIYVSTRQDMTLKGEGELFVLFIADFFLKRYLSGSPDDPLDYLYHLSQGDKSLVLVDTKSIDALTLYLIDKITREETTSIRCEHDVIELMIHRFSLLDIVDPALDEDEVKIAKRAKNHLLKTFANPPTIHELSHICATNESKLKKSFKRVYKTTIYSYIQKLRLEEANLLLKEQRLSIKEVANRVGYNHQGHFSKLFFQNYGVYPKDLIRK